MVSDYATTRMEASMTEGVKNREALQASQRADVPRLLVVEDDLTSLLAVSTNLRKAGYVVVEAKDGASAWDLYDTQEQQECFDLVLTDVRMPVMDGLVLSQKLREADPDLPIVVMTTYDDKETIKQALRLGVSDFIEKPVDFKYLSECVDQLLAMRPKHKQRKRAQETAEAVSWAQNAMLEQGLEQGHARGIRTHFTPYKDAGGDVFHCIPQEDGSLLLLLADVAGHSVESSYAVAALLGMFSANTADVAHTAPLLEKLNTDIQRGPFYDIPVSIMVAKWSPWNGRMRLVNAGIPHPYLYRAKSGTVRALEINGTPLGLFPSPSLETQVVLLEEGDRILLGSDGLFEVRSPSGIFFEEQVDALWASLASVPTAQALDRVCEKAHSWCGGVLSDDLMGIAIEQPALLARDQEWVTSFSSTLADAEQGVRGLLAFLRSTSIYASLPEKQLFDIELAVREATVNGVKHGNREDEKARVGLRCWYTQDMLYVAVTDEGPGVDVTFVSAESSELEEGGRGITLMRTLTSAVLAQPGEVMLSFELPEGGTICNDE